uniref:Uncharacterized protein n=1 Tax=Triticum urartu TaxID=4572 RepID=A0A8R7JZ56_TRIUA
SAHEATRQHVHGLICAVVLQGVAWMWWAEAAMYASSPAGRCLERCGGGRRQQLWGHDPHAPRLARLSCT